MRPMLIDRARDLVRENLAQSPEETAKQLEKEYPEFSQQECLEAVNTVHEVLTYLLSKRPQ